LARSQTEPGRSQAFSLDDALKGVPADRVRAVGYLSTSKGTIQMSDLSGLHGIYPNSLRWNAEDGILARSIFNPESGERELQPIDFGQTATFALDMLTRERGYGKIKIGSYEMILSPVGGPAPEFPGDLEFKPAIGCWLWSPTFDELRLETNAALLRQAVVSVWDQARAAPQAVEGLQPVIRFIDRVSVGFRTLGKTYFSPVIHIVGWAERNKVPGWGERPPTVAAPAAMPLLAAAPAPANPIPPGFAKEPAVRRHKAKKPGSSDSDPDGDQRPFDDQIDDLPWNVDR
jgi:hypothetical protein